MIEASLRTRLLAVSGVTDIVGTGAQTRIFAVQMKQNAKLPAVVITRLGGPRSYFMEGTSKTVRGLFQIDALGETTLETLNLVEAVRAALSGFSGTVGDHVIQGIYLEGDVVSWDDGPDVYRGTMTFAVWYEEA